MNVTVRASASSPVNRSTGAREAGLSKGAVLYHFPAKEELVRGMVAYMVENFNRLLRHLAEA